MSVKTQIVSWTLFGRRTLAIAAMAIVTQGVTASVVAQETAEKTFGEQLKDHWDHLIARMDSSARAAGDEYHKLKDEAAKATGPAREKLTAQMEHLSKSWAIAREKLATATELRVNSLHEEMHELEEKAAKATGPAREKMHAEREKLHGEWVAARTRMEATLSANVQSSHEEIEHLKEHVSTAASDVKAKLAPRMERLKAEFHKNREKLSAYLESDLEHTKAELEKLRAATSNTAELARDKLKKKFEELKARHEALAKERAADEAN